jgi:hypothetical protein
MKFNRPVGTDLFWMRIPAVETAGYFQMPLCGNLAPKARLKIARRFNVGL